MTPQATQQHTNSGQIIHQRLTLSSTSDTTTTRKTSNDRIPVRRVSDDDHLLHGQHLLAPDASALLLPLLDPPRRSRRLLLETVSHHYPRGLRCIRFSRNMVVSPAQALALPKCNHCGVSFACACSIVDLRGGLDACSAEYHSVEYVCGTGGERIVELALWRDSFAQRCIIRYDADGESRLGTFGAGCVGCCTVREIARQI